jgi:hypothetical protein
MAYWKTGHRTINGHRRKVRLLHAGGKIVGVRIAGHINRTDKSAKRMGLHRVRKYRNTPESNNRRGGRIRGYRTGVLGDWM